jgi:hypothetical protein
MAILRRDIDLKLFTDSGARNTGSVSFPKGTRPRISYPKTEIIFNSPDMLIPIFYVYFAPKNVATECNNECIASCRNCP